MDEAVLLKYGANPEDVKVREAAAEAITDINNNNGAVERLHRGLPNIHIFKVMP